MELISEEREARLAELWASADDYTEVAFLAAMDALVDELPADSTVAAHERAGFRDSTGHPDLAVPLYRQALARGLDGSRRREATIQLASSLRNLGQAGESVELLKAEAQRGSDTLDDAVRPFLALALIHWTRDANGRPSQLR